MLAYSNGLATNRKNLISWFALFLGLTFSNSLLGQVFDVVIEGEVEFNLVTFGPLGDVDTGDPVMISFALDQDLFVNNPNFPTRGYEIQEPTFSVDLGSGNVLGLQLPFSGTPFFVIRDNDPAVDGFFLSTNLNNPTGLPLNEPGQLGPFRITFMVTYGGDRLPSLEIADAAGSYDFTGLSVFNYGIDDGPFTPIGIVFQEMGISKRGSCEFEPGDVNEDGNVNLLDVSGFVAAVVNNKPACQADINGDGNVDLLDVEPFVAFLAGE